MQQSILCIIFVGFLLFHASFSYEIPSEKIHEMWRKFQKDVKIAMEGQRQQVELFLKKSVKNVTSECFRDITDLVEGITNQKSWAFKMIDASAKLPTGVLDGSFLQLGDYDECLDIEKLKRNGDVQFTGQYCKVLIAPFLPPKPPRVQCNTPVLNVSSFAEEDSVFFDLLTHVTLFYQHSFFLGVCTPSTCSHDDMQKMISSALKNTPFFLRGSSCEVKEPIQASTLQIVCLSIILLFVVLAILGTITDTCCIPQDVVLDKQKGAPELLANTKETMLVPFLKNFSIQRNLRNIFIPTKSKEHFSAMDGLRAFFLFLIVQSHSFAYSLPYAAGQLSNIQGGLKNIASTFNVSLYPVDIFFTMTAFLTSYFGLKSLHQNNGRLDFFQFYLRRVWRVFPPLAGILLVVFLLPMIGSGPLYKDIVVSETKYCEKNWWQFLLLIFNSWGDGSTGCLFHTWYISCDLILHLVSPLFLIALYRSPRIGFMMILFTILASICTVASVTYMYDLYPTAMLYTPDEEFRMKNMNLILFRPYTHAAPFCVGLALGYIFYYYREVAIKKVYQVMSWCVVIALMMVLRFSYFEWNQGNLPHKAVEIMYASLHRTVHAIGYAWIMYMCFTGRGGIVDRFLSWSFFIPISRLSFTVYLCHSFCVWFRIGLMRTIIPSRPYDVIYFIIGDFVMSVILSVIMYLLFEAPALNLKATLFPKKKYKKHEA